MGTLDGSIYFAMGILQIKNINTGCKQGGDDKKKVRERAILRSFRIFIDLNAFIICDSVILSG